MPLITFPHAITSGVGILSSGQANFTLSVKFLANTGYKTHVETVKEE